MSRFNILVLSFLLISSNAFAEPWVCQKGDSLIRRNGDGTTLGIAGINNSNINPKCILATKQEYADAKLPNKKLDKSVVTGSRVIDMTQAEIDARTLKQQQSQQQAETLRLQAIDDSIIKNRSSLTLTKVDTAIDNIGSLADAKVFLKRLVRYIADK